jgi:hypothetical protein
VDTSNENNSRNDADGAILMLTSIFKGQGYTQDQLLAVYNHQGQNLNATVTYIVCHRSESPDTVVGNLSNVLPHFSRPVLLLTKNLLVVYMMKIFDYYK